VKIGNSSIERVEEFKYLGATLTDQNSIQEEIKSRFVTDTIDLVEKLGCFRYFICRY
jgi:hypothetical protein